MTIDTHDLDFDMKCDLGRKKPHMSIDIYILTWHVLLGMWHCDDILEENVDVN